MSVCVCVDYLRGDPVGVQVHGGDGSRPLGAATSSEPGRASAYGHALGMYGPGQRQLHHQTQHLPRVKPGKRLTATHN